MATYHLDPTAVGSDTGASAANAWSTLQRAVDGTNGTQPAAGDIVLCYSAGSGADETISATIDIDGNSGSIAAGRVTFQGVNSSGTNDGTRYDIDANGNSINILTIGSSIDLVGFENFRLHNTGTGDGIQYGSYATTEEHLWVNILVEDCTIGVDIVSTTAHNARFVLCQFKNNSGAGIETYKAILDKCVIKGNGGVGVRIAFGAPSCLITDCYILENTGNGIDNPSTFKSTIFIKNNVIDGNGGDGIHTDQNAYICENRITNNTSAGINDDGVADLLFNYMPDTAQDGVNGSKTSGIAYNIFFGGANTNNLSGTDSDAGYESSTTDDYNLTDTASMRRDEIDLET